MFSIVIPTFNNLEYLKLCLKSLKNNSKYDHEIIIHINEGSDGTVDYLQSKNFIYTHTRDNVGLCKAVNNAAKLATKKYIVYAHDDMYFCPEWDEVFFNEIKKHNEKKDFFLSGTMIQPFKSFLFLDCGNNIKDFNETKLLKEYKKLKFSDFQGTTWAPSLIPIHTWNKVGGFGEEYSYGLGSDPDFNMKLWNLGVRLFKGLSNCRVYHFSSLSLRSKVWNDGHKIFLLKWGISIKFFRKYYLKSEKVFDGELKDPHQDIFYFYDLFKCKLKYFYLLFLRNLKNFKF